VKPSTKRKSNKNIKSNRISISTAVMVNAALVVAILLLCVFIYLYIAVPFPSPAASENLTSEPHITTVTEPIESSFKTSEHVTTITSAENSTDTITAETNETIDTFFKDDYDKSFFGNTLFIGDSIFTGLSGYGLMPADNVFAEKGLAPSAALTFEIKGRNVLSASDGFDRAVIMLGTNALKGNPVSLADSMKTLVNKLKSENPEMEIAVLTITPVAAKTDYSITIDMVDRYNDALTDAADNGGFILIDICSDFKGDDGYIISDYVQPDGLHLTQEGYKELLAKVQFELE